MAKEVTCPPCGVVLRADDDEELIRIVQEHARADHDTELNAQDIIESAREV